MPFDPDNPPEKVRGLSPKKQRQWVHVFNSCYEKHHDDETCHKQAWGAVKGGKSACEGDPVCEVLTDYFDALMEGRVALDWEEMEEKMKERRDPEGIESDSQMMEEFRAACREIEAADRIALEFMDEVKVKKLKGIIVKFLHKLGDFRDEFGQLVSALMDSVENKRSLREFPELEDILALGRAMKQVRLDARDVEGRLMRVVTVDA
jgi:hypothetical protein